MGKIRALVFDFDGVIIDTETPDYLTWQELYSSFGVELDRGLWSRYIGGGAESFDAYQHLESLIGRPIERAEVRHRRRQRYLEIVEASPILPGVLEYIQEARGLGLRLGVASSSSRGWVEGHLARRGLLQYFEVVKSADDVARIKPDPELYLASVAQLGSQPGGALAIEDSFNGVTAAKRAGLFCVAVPNPMTEHMPLQHADLRLRSLAEVPLKSVLAIAEEGARKSLDSG